MANGARVVGFLGLGKMGAAMARNLADSGFRLRLWNRTRSKAVEVARGIDRAEVCETPREAAQTSDFVVSSVANDDAVRAITFGPDGLLAGQEDSAVHLETTTLSLALSRELEAAHREAQRAYVASHVFGRPDAAAQRKLWIAAGGSAEDIDRSAPVLEAISQGTFRFEQPHQATLVKLCGNLVLASIIEALGESFALAEKGGVEPSQLAEVLNAVFASPAIRTYGTLISRGAFRPAGFKTELGFKDVRLALQAAEELRVPLPAGGVAHDHLVEALAKGHQDADWSVFASVLREASGLTGPRGAPGEAQAP